MEEGGNFVSIGGSKKSITFPATPEGFSIYRHASSEITEKIGEAGSSDVGAEMYRNLLKRLAQGELVLRSQLKTEFDNNNAAEFTTSATKSPSFRKDFSKASLREPTRQIWKEKRTPTTNARAWRRCQRRRTGPSGG
jgi:hypothetical protein